MPDISGMTNAQCALMAAATRYSTRGVPLPLVLREADEYLKWLEGAEPKEQPKDVQDD